MRFELNVFRYLPILSSVKKNETCNMTALYEYTKIIRNRLFKSGENLSLALM